MRIFTSAVMPKTRTCAIITTIQMLPRRHVEAVHADEREEGGQESAAVGAGALADHGDEVMHLKPEEDQTEQQRDRQP